jgi:hypothetical protein
MEAGGAAADNVKTAAVMEVDASAEAVGGDGGAGESNKMAVAARTTTMEASVIGPVVVGPMVVATPDLDAYESATGEARPMREHPTSQVVTLPQPSSWRRIWWRRLHRPRPRRRWRIWSLRRRQATSGR